MKTSVKIPAIPFDLLMRVAGSLDRTAIVMIVVVWMGALSMVGLALYTLAMASRVAHQAETIAALEPVVPTMQRAGLQRPDLEKFAERLKKRFRGINFNILPDGALDITAAEASNFTDWLAALSYLDTIAPEIRWNIRDLCIGGECGGTPMHAVITGERVSFKPPDMPTPESIAAPDASVKP